MKLDEYLNEQHVPFEKLPHRPAYTANRIAKVLHVPGKEVAKTVLLHVDDHYVLAVLPATRHVDLDRVRQELGATSVRLATEGEMTELFPDCQPGAIPPFGSLYHLTTLVDESLAEDEEIVFEGQTHEEAIRMTYRDFEEHEHPHIGHFASSDLQEMVDTFADRLVKRVRKQMPSRLRQRVDPEDVVQTVFRNFFQRIADGRFTFEDSHHVWRLLTLLAYHEVQTLLKHHQDSRRDVRREKMKTDNGRAYIDPEPGPDEVASVEDLFKHLLEELPVKHRTIVSLRMEGFSVADIARKTRLAQSTVRKVITKVQEAIQREMERST